MHFKFLFIYTQKSDFFIIIIDCGRNQTRNPRTPWGRNRAEEEEDSVPRPSLISRATSRRDKIHFLSLAGTVY